MNEAECNILGYSSQASEDKNDRYQPTFPPKEIYYDTYPWRDTPSSPNVDDNENNALCFLMLFNPPRHGPQAITDSGQWVDVNNGMANCVLNRLLLWPWMHTVLRDVVIAMIPAPTTPASNPNDGNDYETISEDCNLPNTSGGTLTFGHYKPNFRTFTNMTFTLKWTLSIALATLEDGAVVFQVGDPSFSTQGALDPSSNLHWGEPVHSSEIFATISAKVGLENALANQHRLYLPAKGYLLMHDPVFNDSGDLLVGMEYNGAPPPTSPPQ
ncbi:hypothetical protein HDV57DRAFT_516897 [Trichoderma longibrachiatum]|uniref:Uncharacterized protein n=1 Tax=Trichoderma longibrachiatum ATCC 18648 TaxID=983965 RepID=A0A2T4C5B3_TRILO|nr:hypothetical protein M440DRAFT_1421843 [Trichoderma longibrachiatum ATCC 18648]